MPVSKAQQKAVSKYMKENYDEIKIRIPKGQKELVQAFAKAQIRALIRLFGILSKKKWSGILKT